MDALRRRFCLGCSIVLLLAVGVSIASLEDLPRCAWLLSGDYSGKSY